MIGWPLDDFVDDEPSVKKPCVGEKEEENLSPDERWAVVYCFLQKNQLLYEGKLIEDWTLGTFVPILAKQSNF